MIFSNIYIILLVIYAVILVFVISTNDLYSRKFKLRKEMYLLLSNSIKNIVNTSDSDWNQTSNTDLIEKFDEEIQFLFNKSCEYNRVEADLNLLISILERYVYIFTLKGGQFIKKLYKVEASDLEVKFIKDYLIYLKNTNVFSNVSTKQRVFLNDVYKAIETNNMDLGKVALNQLSTELEKNINQIKEQNRKNKISYYITIVSFFLTIFFGIIPFIKK